MQYKIVYTHGSWYTFPYEVYRKYSFGWAIVNTYLTLKGAKRKVAKIAREEAKKSGKDSDSETIWEGVIV